MTGPLHHETFELIASGIKALTRIADAIDNSPSSGVTDAFTQFDDGQETNVVDALCKIADAISDLAAAVREHD